MPTPSPHFILSFKTSRARNGCPRRTEVFVSFGYDGLFHPQSLDMAEPQSLGEFPRPEYARLFGWQKLLESMEATGLDPAEVCFVEMAPNPYDQPKQLDLHQVQQCARKAAESAARMAARKKPAAEPAYA